MANGYNKTLTSQIFNQNAVLSENLLGGEMQNPSRLLAKIGGNPAHIYEDMLDDDHIFAVSEILISGILRHNWRINSNKKSEIKRLTEMFNLLPIRDVVSNIVYGKLKGMSIFEVVWAYENKKYFIKNLIPLKNTDFSLDSENNLIYKENMMVFDDKKYKYKFLKYINKPYENPYGVAELLKCYYPWQFKRGGWKFWMTTTEKYGVPTMVVDFDPTDVDGGPEGIKAKAEELAEAFSNIDSDAVVVTNGLGSKSQIKVIEVTAKSDEFMNLIEKAEASISKVIIGTHVIMDGSNGGSRALSEVAANINFRFKVQTLIYSICECLNELLLWESIIQTGKNNPYGNEFIIPYVNIQDWEKIREAIQLGIPVSKKSVYYYVPEPEDEDDIFIIETKVPDIDKDLKKGTKESKSDTSDDRRSKTKKQTQETREETSIPGKQVTDGE